MKNQGKKVLGNRWGPGLSWAVPFFLAMGVICLSGGCQKSFQPLPQKDILIGDIPIRVEVACLPATRHRGLMNRQELPEDGGMIFVFPETHQGGFWMKDTPLPLSIAFINSYGLIIEIQDMEPFSLEDHSPTGPYLYALEMNQGWFLNHKIKAGALVRGLSGLKEQAR